MRFVAFTVVCVAGACLTMILPERWTMLGLMVTALFAIGSLEGFGRFWS